MTLLPLEMRYFYDRENSVYRRIGTHHTITIAEYEELERQENRAAAVGVVSISIVVIFVFLVLATLLFKEQCF